MKKKLLSIILAAVMLLSLLPATVFAQDGAFSDTSDHWAATAIETWAGRNVISGYAGEFRPNAPITRAEIAAVLNHVMGYTEAADIAFADVPSDAWYAEHIAKLYAAGIMAGDGDGVMRPTADITREEAAVLIAHTFAVPENAGNETPFPDAANISGWASFLVDGMKAAGYINGDPNGNFNPKSPITRAEVVTILNNIVDDFYNVPGEYDSEYRSFTPRNVVIRSAGVTLKNSIISGNLYITDGNVTLDNVTVSGTTFVRGGANSVRLSGGSYSELVFGGGNNTHVDISGIANLDRVYISNTGRVTHGGMTVSYSAQANTLTFGGTLDVVELNADGTATITVGGIAYDIIPPLGTISKFALAPGAVVNQMIANGAANVSGTGKIDKMIIRDDGVVIDKSVNVCPQDITVDDGVKITVADKNYIGDGKTLPPNTPSGGTSSGTSGGTGGSTGGNGSTTAIAVTGVTVSPSAIDATSGTAIAAQQLTASVSVTGGASQVVSWSVYDAGTTGTDKVTITADGKLSVAADATAGTAVIRATSVYDASKYGTCTVTISPAPTYSVALTNITGQNETTHGTISITQGNQTGNAFNAAITVTATPQTGYVFIGWVETNSLTATPVSTANPYTFPITSNTTLYAVFEAAAYTVTLNANGGTGTPLTAYTYGVGATLPTDYTRANYIFAGWHDNVGLTGSAITEISATDAGDKEYWAAWTETYTMTLGVVPGYGANNWVSIDRGNPTGNAQGADVKVEAIPETGYIFVGWVEANDRTAAIVSTDAEYTFTITKNTTLYAIFNGDGSAALPIEIATAAELDAVRTGLTLNYKLIRNITLTSAWTPIGDWSTRFTGTFDGGGHTITLGADVAVADDFAGLFGVIGVSGKVRNLTVAGNISVSGVDVIIGGIAGYNLGTIEKCAMLGDVIVTDGDRSNVGGIAGWGGIGSTITSCYSLGAINANGSEYNYVGGIAGRGQGGAIITNCYSLGNITASGGSTRNSVGGIVGELTLDAIASYCYVMGAVSASGSTNESAGGIAGRSDGGRIENCVALNSSVSVGGGSNIGRIVGDSSNSTLSGNRTIAMGTLPDGAHDNSNGATIGTGDVLAADYWKNTTNGIWEDVFAAYPSDTNPWVVADGELPHLYWQATAPTLPTHFPTGASAASPITVSTATGLAAIANGLDKHYKLLNYIDVGTDWTPIGSTTANAFTGSLNGNGKTVVIGGIASGLAEDLVNGGYYTYAGLFGYIGAGGVVERLAVLGTVEHADANDINVFIGGIAGGNHGTIRNCYTMAIVSGTALGSRAVYAGGIAGYNVGMIENCYASRDVTGSGDFTSVGGIAGLNDYSGTVQNCVALNSELSGTGGTAFIGRVVGLNNDSALNPGALTHNYGSTAMTREPSGLWSYKTATGIDGADVTFFSSVVHTWWESSSGLSWDWGSIWEVSDNNYPTLR